MLFLPRMLLMAVNFFVAGTLGLLVSLLRPFNPANGTLSAKLYAWPTRYILGMRVRADVRSLQDLTGPCVLVGNHQSNYDLFLFGNVIPPRTVAIGKKSLKWVPLFGTLFWLAGNVLVERENAYKARKALQRVTDTLRHRNASIWVFPEGTRNTGSELLPFKKGAFQMAIAAGVPVVPVCMSRYPGTLDLNRWRSGEILIRSLPPISTTGLTTDDIAQLALRCREQMQACIDELDRQTAG